MSGWRFDYELEDEDSEVKLGYECTGDRDPGRTYGPPEDCYPGYEDDDRVLEYIEITVGGETVTLTPKDLTKEAWKKVAGKLEKVIYKTDLADLSPELAE